VAAFTTQFERTNPFISPDPFRYLGWSYQLWEETNRLLSEVSIPRRIAIALQIETLLMNCVAQRKFTVSGAMQRVAQGQIYAHCTPQQIRELYGDFNLLKEVHDTHDWDSESIQSAKWERFGVFSLWKLCDAGWENLHWQCETGLSQIPDEGMPIRMPNDDLVVACYFEAMQALQVAQTILLTERLISERNRDSTIKAQIASEENRRKALLMADAQPFRSLEKAATYISEHLVKSVGPTGAGTTYSVDWVKRWLREAGWKPAHKRT